MAASGEAEVSYKCPCGKQFKRQAPYQRHLDIAHSRSASESRKCSVCGKTFGSATTLTMHMSVHQDSKVFARMESRSIRARKGSSRERVAIPTALDRNISEDLKHAPSTRIDNTVRVISSSGDESSGGTDKENFTPERRALPDDTESSDSGGESGVAATRRHSDIENEDPCRTSAQQTVQLIDQTRVNTDVAETRRDTPRESVSLIKISSEEQRRSVITFKSGGMPETKAGLGEAMSGEQAAYFHPNMHVPVAGGHSVIVIKTEPLHRDDEHQHGDALMTSYAEVKEEDLDDQASVRKSVRLKGKVPGWKTLMDDDLLGAGDYRGARRRKMPPLKSELDPDDMLTFSDGDIEMGLLCASQDMHFDETTLSPPELGALSRRTNPRPSSKCDFKCTVCDRAFVSEKYLSMHMALHRVGHSLESLMTTTTNKEKEEEQQQQQQYAVEVVPALADMPGGAVGSNAKKVRSTREGAAYWTCKICDKSFAQNSNYKNHIRTHSDERPFVCDICSIGFKERYHLKKHMLFKHSNELKEECRYCGKKFKDSTAVRAHERIHSDLRPYACRRCGKTFKTSECLWHHENRSKTCGLALVNMPPAGQRFRRGRQSRKELREIRLAPAPAAPAAEVQMHIPIPIPIPVSAAPAPPPQQALPPPVHVPVHVPGPVVPPVAALSGSVRPRMSAAPEEVIAGPRSVVANVVSSPTPAQTVVTPAAMVVTAVGLANPVCHSSSAPSAPPLCANTLTAAAAAVANSMDVGAMPTLVPATSPPVVVKVEPELNLPDYELTAMAADPSFDDDFANSPEAKEMLENYDRLEAAAAAKSIQILPPELNHLGVNTQQALEDIDSVVKLEEKAQKDKQQQFTCETCGKQFSSEASFDKHLMSHSDIRPYRCNLCDIGFKLKVHLKKHNLYRHSDEYPCECSICGKKFKDTSAVRLHERIHSDSRPYKCECGKSFKTRENLWGHRHRGPCERNTTKDLFFNDGCGEGMDMGPPCDVYASLGDGQASAHASVSNNQIIARAVISNSMITAQATIGHNGEMTASASIDGPAGKKEAKVVSTAGIVYSQVNGRVSLAAPITTATTACTAVRPSILPLPRPAAVNPNGHVPTAVVAPIKRKREEQKQQQQELAPLSCGKEEKMETSLPPFETFVPCIRSQMGATPGCPALPVSAKQMSIADRCPTIQKYLLQSARQPVKLPGIQQLFQSHSLVQRCNAQRSLPSSVSSAFFCQPGSAASLPSMSPCSSLAPSPVTCPTYSPGVPSPKPFSRRQVSANGIRATSPYPGFTPSGLPLLGDPNFASTSNLTVNMQSPQEPPISGGSAGIPVIYWDDESEKRTMVTTPWQSDPEALFNMNELSNSTLNQL